MTSSMATQVVSVLRRSPIPGLGASGIVVALIGITAMFQPHQELAIIFLPFVTFSAMTGLQALIAFDLFGLAMGWTGLGHAAHLGGSLFGVWYAMQPRSASERERSLLTRLGVHR